jgi:hypothetical protein
MANDAGKQVVARLMERYGCLPAAADGPIVDEFDPIKLAQAIEQESRRAIEYGWPKITVHMDLPDAMKLAKHLRG